MQTTKSTNHGSDRASTIAAIVIVFLAAAAIAYFIYHFVLVVKVALSVAGALLMAALISNTGIAKRLGAKGWVNNQWTWWLVLLLSFYFVWHRDVDGVWVAILLLALRLFITPIRPKTTASDARSPHW